MSLPSKLGSQFENAKSEQIKGQKCTAHTLEGEKRASETSVLVAAAGEGRFIHSSIFRAKRRAASQNVKHKEHTARCKGFWLPATQKNRGMPSRVSFEGPESRPVHLKVAQRQYGFNFFFCCRLPQTKAASRSEARARAAQTPVQTALRETVQK